MRATYLDTMILDNMAKNSLDDPNFAIGDTRIGSLTSWKPPKPTKPKRMNRWQTYINLIPTDDPCDESNKMMAALDQQ